MSSSPYSKILRRLLLGIVLVGCIATLFVMYFKPSVSWLSGPTESSAVSTDIKSDLVLSTKSNKNLTTVLVWFWPFSHPFNLGDCKALFNIDDCFLTADRSLYNISDGVVFHHRDIKGDLSNMPQLQRPYFQKWVWWNRESPTHSNAMPGIDSLFNVTLNYRQDADIEARYGIITAAEEEEDFVLPSKNKLVCWIVSNWNPEYTRVKYYNELKQHIEVHTFGGAMSPHLHMSPEDYAPTIASCKFYLSFENSIHKDYITEKLYNPLSMGSVPVVLGTSRQNYESFIQGDAFIHVDDFKTAKEMAEYLQLLDKNQELYLRYFAWRKHFKVRRRKFAVENTCMACDYLRRHKEYSVKNNLKEWYWGG